VCEESYHAYPNCSSTKQLEKSSTYITDILFQDSVVRYK